MHELRGGARIVHHVHGDLVLRIEDVHVGGAFLFVVVQAIPNVGINEIGALDALDIVGDSHGATGDFAVLLGDGDQVDIGINLKTTIGDLMALGAELYKIHAHLRSDEHQGHAHLSRVTDEGDFAVFDVFALGQILDHGKQIAELLRGVIVFRHAVDNRACCVFSQIDDVLMAIDARHKNVDQAAHNAAGVFDGFMASKLNSAGAVELSMAAEVGHGRLEGDAGARGHLLENHAERLVLQNQRIAPGLLHGLHGARELDHVEELFFGEVVSVDVVLHCHGFLLVRNAYSLEAFPQAP